MTTLAECAGTVDMPFLVELKKDIILACLQAQVRTPIDPDSLAYDAEGFTWEEGEVALDLTFKDQEGTGRGVVYLQVGVNKELDICFLLDAQFIEYLPYTDGLN